MQKISIVLIILILGLAYSTQDEGIQVLNPQFGGNDLTIPKSINFQGYLYRDGNPMDTTMNMWFGIYDAPSNGTQLFQQTINNVLVTKGWFTVSLDNIPNSVFPVSGPIRYLEVKAPSTGPSLSPRISLISVAYSYHSITSDSAEYAKAAPLTGSAGGDLTGTYPNPTIANNAVNSTKILDGSIKGIDIVKPCSLEASIVWPNAMFVAKNNGNGNGIEVTKAGTDGFRVFRAGDDGMQVDSARYGFSLYRAALDGIWIARAGDNGIYIDSVNNHGLHVNCAIDGVYIDSVGAVGYWIGKCSQAGFHVGYSGSGLDVGYASVGVNILKAGAYGVYIDSAGQYGVLIRLANSDGVRVDSAYNYGVKAMGIVGGIYGEGPITYTLGYGVYGYARAKGVYGRSNYWEGVFGSADSDDAVQGNYNGTYGSYAGVRGERGSAGYGVYYVGGIGGSDKMSTIVKTSKGPVAVYAQESPENWFEDFGEGKLINGKAHIELDRLFLEIVNINQQYPMKVFVQLTSGEPMNLVIKKDYKGFDVIAADQTSNATFDYRVVAKRKGFENFRLKTEEIGYTDQQLYPDLNDPQIPTQIRAKRLEEIENRKKEDEMRKNNQLEKAGKEVRTIRLEKR